jgi:hypothetical protein
LGILLGLFDWSLNLPQVRWRCKGSSSGRIATTAIISIHLRFFAPFRWIKHTIGRRWGQLATNLPLFVTFVLAVMIQEANSLQPAENSNRENSISVLST